ncbi:MAG: UDP-N-acetylmuramoyl-L-alanine--D-glutamate ligase [Puniceicoccales bacterium]|jgi:UDP-N-acetylmuramoylalanine--D-glutamate ligase|nr:UDP-N-acetylmuramoyl-L-alanine--D-glutamate ligase [Puniceicoccales bacterium]
MLDKIFSKNFRIGILGYGVSGRAVAEWCAGRGIAHNIFSENSEAVFGDASVDSCDLVVRSPSFLNDHPWVARVCRKGVECVGELDLAARFWRGKIVAVTGTDGKTTTVEFLKYSLGNGGHRAVAVGNIGLPFISVVDGDANAPDSWAIVEVSSFQAQQLRIMRPDYVLWTNFAPDHMDSHYSLSAYFGSKYRLVERAKVCDGEHVFIGESVKAYAQNSPEFSPLNGATVCQKTCYVPLNSCLSIAVQRENFALVEKFWRACNLSLDILNSSAETFKLPKHRLQKICSVEKISPGGEKFITEFWNDSKATNFHSFKAALDSFNQRLILMVGGKSKGEEVGPYIKILSEKAKTLLLLGEMGKIIFIALYKNNLMKTFEHCEFFGDLQVDSPNIMRNMVRYAFSIANGSDIILLCPGFSSLDMFSGYDQRGCLYEKYVGELAG